MANNEPEKPLYFEPAAGAGGMTELHYSSSAGDLEGVVEALAQGLAVNGQDSGNWTPLHWVVDMGLTGGRREEIVQTLLNAGADLEAQDLEGRTPLHVACQSQATYLAVLLLAREANREARDHKGKTPLMTATAAFCHDAVRLLLKHGADPNARANNGKTALDLAIEYDYPEIAGVLRAWPEETG